MEEIELTKAEQQLKDLEDLMNFKCTELDRYLEENKEILKLIKDEKKTI